MIEKNQNSLFQQSTYLLTGFKQFDDAILFSSGQLIGIGARPEIGIENFFESLCLNLARQGKKIQYVTSRKAISITKNLIMKLTGLNEIQCVKGTITGEEYQKFVWAVNEINKYDIVVSDGNSDLEWDRVIIIEDIYDVAMEQNSGSMHEKITEQLFDLRKGLNDNDTIVFVGLHFSRKVFDRHGHFPRITDIHECSNAEIICDHLFALMRRDAYDELDKPGTAEIYSLKGPKFKIQIPLTVHPITSLYEDYIFLKKPSEMDEATQEAFADFKA